MSPKNVSAELIQRELRSLIERFDEVEDLFMHPDYDEWGMELNEIRATLEGLRWKMEFQAERVRECDREHEEKIGIPG